MRVVDITEILPGAKKRINLHHICDTHLGAPDVDEEALRHRVSLIDKDPNGRWTFGGDGGDLIKFSDRRYQPDELHHRYRQATDMRYATMEHMLEVFSPIKDKCWGICDGNHERKYDEFNGGKFGCEFACNLGIPNRWVDYRGFIRVEIQMTKTQRTPLLLDLQHGWQAGRRVGSPHNQAELELGFTEADVVLRGHSHSPFAQPFVTLGVSGGKAQRVRRRTRYVVNGGTWRLGYRDGLASVDPDRLSEVEGSLWAERKGYRPSPVGGPVLVILPHGGQRDKPATLEMAAIENLVNEETLGL